MEFLDTLICYAVVFIIPSIFVWNIYASLRLSRGMYRTFWKAGK
jgi:hypothetical protein